MFLTNVLLKKVKSKYVMVLLQSTGSSHCRTSFRERLEPKKEILAYDPYVEMNCVYKELKKIRSIKRDIQINQENCEHKLSKIDFSNFESEQSNLLTAKN